MVDRANSGTVGMTMPNALTFCVEVVLAVLGLAALLAVFAGALWVVQFSGGLI